jgi:hypothetical protein
MDNFSTAIITDLQHVPVTSVEVERSFSIYIKKIFNKPLYQYDS